LTDFPYEPEPRTHAQKKKSGRTAAAARISMTPALKLKPGVPLLACPAESSSYDLPHPATKEVIMR
jgi:hypothetical protein